MREHTLEKPPSNVMLRVVVTLVQNQVASPGTNNYSTPNATASVKRRGRSKGAAFLRYRNHHDHHAMAFSVATYMLRKEREERRERQEMRERQERIEMREREKEAYEESKAEQAQAEKDQDMRDIGDNEVIIQDAVEDLTEPQAKRSTT